MEKTKSLSNLKDKSNEKKVKFSIKKKSKEKLDKPEKSLTKDKDKKDKSETSSTKDNKTNDDNLERSGKDKKER